MNESLQQIIERSKDISNSASLINDISDRINLLSLNAAIEAASTEEINGNFTMHYELTKSLVEMIEIFKV